MPEPLLVIYHNPSAADLCTSALNDAGFFVHRVGTQREGLEFLTRNAVAGIVLEHSPPFVDGLQMLRCLRAQRIRSPVIVVSKSASADLAVSVLLGSTSGA